MRFRTLLPISQGLACGLLGLLGAWQRIAGLNRMTFGDQPLWNTTARFHFWPWPYKLAVSVNLPSFIAGGLLVWPLGRRWQLAEYTAMALSLLIGVLLWYWIGSRLDRSVEAKYVRLRTVLVALFVFDFVCLAGALTLPGVFGLGVLTWFAAVILLSRLRATR